MVDEVAPRHPEVTVEHALVDSTAYLLLTDPRRFDVIVTENLFGDILSDEAAAISGLARPSRLGLASARAPREHGTFGMYEPVHGSAPQIAGTGTANPLADVASAALLLRHSLGESDAGRRARGSGRGRHRAGPRTADLGGGDATDEVTEFLLERIGATRRRCAGMSDPIVLYDTTLRDGTQREGLVLSAWRTS